MAKPPAHLDEESSWFDWLKLKRWLQLIRRLVAVESAIETLKSETKSNHSQIVEMQRELDRLQVQLSTLTATTQTTIDDKVRIAVLEIVPALVERELERRNRR
jgi:hypothetical protein